MLQSSGLFSCESAQYRREDVEEAGADEGGAGDGQDPSPKDAAGNAPTHGREATRGADADDGAGDGVGGADGNAKPGVHDEGDAASRFGSEAAEGSELGDALAHGFNNAPTASHGAAAHGEMATDDDPVRDGKGGEQAAGDKSCGDDAHALLGVIRAVAQAEEGGGDQLQAAEGAVDFARALFADNPTSDGGKKYGENHSHNRRNKNEEDRPNPATDDEGLESDMGNSRAAVATDESMGRAGGQAENEGNEVPRDSAEQTGEKNLLRDHFEMDHAFADSGGNRGTEEEGGDEVPEGGPGDGAQGREDAGGDDSGDGVGGVVPAVREFEGESEDDDRDEEGEAGHRDTPWRRENRREIPRFARNDTLKNFGEVDFAAGIGSQADLMMTPSMTLATSSHLSTAVSMTSKISFHFMIWTGSFSSSKSWAISVRQMRSLSFS